MAQSADLTSGLGRLAESSRDGSADLETLVADILKLLGDDLEVGATFLTRADVDSLRIERVYDRSGMRLAVGDRLPLPDTSGGPLIVGSLRPLLIGPPRPDLTFASPTVKRDLGIAAYSGVLLYTSAGELYGTLGTLQAQARSLKEGEATLLALAGRFIMHAIESHSDAEKEAEAEPETARPEIATPAFSFAFQEIDPAFLVDLDGRIRAFNAAAEDLSNFASDAVVGLQLIASGLLPPNGITAMLDAMNRAIAGQDVHPFDVEVSRSDGSTVPVEARLTVVEQDDGEAVQVTLRDATDRRQAREQVEQLTAEQEEAREEIVRLRTSRQHIEEELSLVSGQQQEARNEVARLTSELERSRAANARLTEAQQEAQDEIAQLAAAQRDAAVRSSAGDEATAVRARASEATFRALLEASPLPMIALDTNGNVRSWNAASEYLLGWRVDDVLGAAPPFLAPEAESHFRVILGRALAGEEVSGEEILYRRRDGSSIPLRVTASPSFDGLGGIDGVLLTHIDNSERRQMGDALRDVAVRYLGLVEGAPDVLLITDMEGAIALASRRAADIHGYNNPEEMVGLELAALVSPDDCERVIQTLQRTLRSGEPGTGIFSFAGSGGKAYSGDAHISLMTDDQGQPAAAVILVRDVSEQLAAQRTLEESLQREREVTAGLEEERDQLRAQTHAAAPDLESELGERLARALEEHRQAEETWQQTLAREREARVQTEGALAELREADRDLVAMLERERAIRTQLESERSRLLSRIDEESGEATSDLNLQLAEERESRQRQETEWHGIVAQEREAREHIERALLSVMRASPSAIVQYDADGHVRAWNPGSEKLFGWTQAEAMGMPLPLLPDDRRQDFRNLLSRVRSGESLNEVPLRFRGKDTLWHDVRFSAVPLYDIEGDVAGIFAIMTEPERDATAGADETVRPLLDLSPDALVQVDPHGTIIYGNSRAAGLTGFGTPSALLGARLLERVAQAERERVAAALQQWRSSPEATPATIEISMEKEDGTLFPAELAPLETASRGQRSNVLTLVLRDLTQRKQIEDTVEQLRRQNEALLEVAEDGIVGIDLWGRVTFVNPALTQLTGYSAEELMGQSLHQILHGGSDAAAGHSNEQCPLYTVLRDRTPQRTSGETFFTRGGSSVMADCVATPLRQGSKLIGAMLVVRASREASTPDLRSGLPTEGAEALSPLLESAPLPAAVTDSGGVYVDVNRAYCALLGYTRDELIGKHFFTVIPENTRDKFATLYEQWLGAQIEASDEHDLITKDGRTITVLESSMPLPGNPDSPRRASVLLDITARKAAEEEVEQAARHDILTDLPSRPIFQDRLNQALAYAKRHGQLVGLLHVDIDGFGQLNRALGQNAGDMLLHEVADRLRAVTRELDTVARVTADDFVVILPDVGSAQNVAVVARKVLAEFAKGFTVFGETMTVTGSIGISLFPFDGSEADTLLSSAEAGMYRAKDEGGNTLVFYGAGVD